MSIHDIAKKINPVVNFKDKIYYGVKPLWTDKAVPMISRVKEGLDLKEDLFIVFSIILIGMAGFGLGKLSALEKGRDQVQIKPANFIATSTISSNINTNITANVPMSASAMIATESAKGMLLASKNGTKYHFPWCAGAKQIAEKNMIWFNSYEEAQKAGYTAASNCPGLK